MKRLATAAVGVPIFFVIIKYLDPRVFFGVVAVGAILATCELHQLAERRGVRASRLLGVLLALAVISTFVDDRISLAAVLAAAVILTPGLRLLSRRGSEGALEAVAVTLAGCGGGVYSDAGAAEFRQYEGVALGNNAFRPLSLDMPDYFKQGFFIYWVDGRNINLTVQLGDEKTVTTLARQLTACGRRFGSMYESLQIERMVFLSGQVVDRDVCAAIAKQLKMPARMGDCLAAVKIAYHDRLGIDRRASASAEMTPVQKQSQANWATAFGLSLSQN